MWVSSFSASYGCLIIPTAKNTFQNHHASSTYCLENYPKGTENVGYKTDYWSIIFSLLISIILCLEISPRDEFPFLNMEIFVC